MATLAMTSPYNTAVTVPFDVGFEHPIDRILRGYSCNSTTLKNALSGTPDIDTPLGTTGAAAVIARITQRETDLAGAYTVQKSNVLELLTLDLKPTHSLP